MNIFYLTTIVTFLLAILAIMFKDKKKNPNLLITMIIMAIFTLVSGLRNGIGDTYYYIHSYKLLVSNYQIINSIYEPGFTLFLMILKNISDNPQFMILITSTIINVLNIYVIRKYSKDAFELGVFLYITSYYIVTMNGIRQSLVAAIIFLCTPLIMKRKFKLYSFIMILLSTFHISALIMIPIYWIVIQEEWSKKIWISVALFLVAMIFYEPIMSVIYKMLGSSKYAGYETFNEGGANIVRIIIYFVPVYLSYIKRIELKQWDNGNIFTNMTLINFIIMAFAYYNWIFARFTIYTQLYVLILLPYIVKKTFANRKEKRLFYYLLITCYALYFVLDSRVSGIFYTSDFSIDKLFY